MKIHRLFKVMFVALGIFCTGILPVRAEENAIQIKGSDTMVNLGQAWAEEFMIENPQTSIAVTGGGSGTGIAALINGTCDIAEASREMKPQEIELSKKNGHDAHEFKVAIDALAVVVHPSNPVKQLTFDQLSGIFTGKITNWNEVGGNDQKILALSRDRNSGTHVYFLEHILRKGVEKGPEQFAPEVLMLPSSQSIIDEVSQSQTAIGYIGLGYVSPAVKTVAVSKASEGPFVLPSLDTAMNKTYPVARPLLFYTGREPQGTIKNLIDFVLSKKGQEIVRTMDFVPLGDKA